jgi:signal transduction histidine kinase
VARTLRFRLAVVRAVCTCLGAVIFLLPTIGVATAESKRVLLLYSFGREFKPWSDYAETIRSELNSQSPWPLDITEQSLITARSSDENPETAFVEYLRALFAKHPLDLIVGIGAPAAGFIQRHRPQLFATTPMVFTAVDQRRVQYSDLTANDAVVAVRIDYLGAIKNILQLLPDTKHVAVVVGTSPIEQFWREEIAKEVKPLENRIAFTWYNALSFEDILKHAAALPPHSAIFWELMSVDAAGVVHEGNTALARLHAVANAPIFSYDESFFGNEIVGGPLLSVLEVSRQTAAVAVRILGGEKAGDIEVPPVGFASPKFDWREMQRWGISESLLPAKSEVRFREPTVWDQYHRQIVMIGMVLLLQTVLIGVLLRENHRRRRAEASASKLQSDLAHMNRVATAGELAASIAHEIKQPLASIVNQGSAGLNWLKKNVPDLDQARLSLQSIVSEGHRADAVINNIRAMFRNESTVRSLVDVNELIQRVLTLVTHKIGSIALETDFAKKPAPCVRADPVQLQQVVLNLIMNAVEAMGSSAGQARELRLRTEIDPADTVLITVADTGPGIDPKVAKNIFQPFFTTKPSGMGMGLSICKSIIESHEGRLTATPGELCGTVFQIRLPNADANAGERQVDLLQQDESSRKSLRHNTLGLTKVTGLSSAVTHFSAQD